MERVSFYVDGFNVYHGLKRLKTTDMDTIFLVKTRHLWSITRQIFDDVPKCPKRRKTGKIYKLKMLAAMRRQVDGASKD